MKLKNKTSRRNYLITGWLLGLVTASIFILIKDFYVKLFFFVIFFISNVLVLNMSRQDDEK